MKEKPEIVLASASPRRRELLARIGVRFSVLPSGVDERPWPGEKPASYALRNALDKAREVAARCSATRILSADTIVVLGDRILEKPEDHEHAASMLRELSGRRHEVITGLCLLHRNSHRVLEWGDAVRTAVHFRPLDEAEIRAYVASGEPMDKAGAYAIQGGAGAFVSGTEGSYTNVVGLPVERLTELLAALDAATTP